MGKLKRVRKAGCFFSGLKITGLLIKVLGSLTFLSGLIIQIYYSVKLSPDIMDMLRNFKDQTQLGGFILMLMIVNLGFFASITCTGLVLLGLGFLFDLLSTKPIENEDAIDKPHSIA